MGLAGYAATVKVTGTPVAFTAAATTDIGADASANPRRQITDATKRILDESAAITVKDGGVAVDAADFSVDWNFGIITFTGHTPAGAITVDGTYLPTLTVLGARGYSLSSVFAELDATDYDSGGVEEILGGVAGASGELESIEAVDTDLDSGAGSVITSDLVDNRTSKVLEIRPGGTGKIFRARVVFPSLSVGGGVSDLETQTLQWRTSRRKALNRAEYVSHGWGT